MTDDFEELPYKVGRMDGDQRRYYRNRPMAQTFANRGAELYGGAIVSSGVELEPDHGFVAILYSEGPLPSAWEEGYEVRDVRRPQEPEPTPGNWAQRPTGARHSAKSPPVGTSTPTAPSKGATARVWAIADELNESSPLTRADRAKVIDKCIEAGINKSTAATQWSKWAKAKGL